MLVKMNCANAGGGGVNKIAIGTVTYNDSRWTDPGVNGECSIEVGFEPTHIIWYLENNTANAPFLSVYSEELKNGDYFLGSTMISGSDSSTSSSWHWINNGRKSGQNPWMLGLQSIDAVGSQKNPKGGFTIGYKNYQDWSSYTMKWIAVQINE